MEKTARTRSARDVYPDELRRRERELIAQRRRKKYGAGADPQVGVALSGGGIRSATFCLGIFQGLARLDRRDKGDRLGSIDFLSTVSGGSYFGSFYGRMFSRPEVRRLDDVHDALATDPVPEQAPADDGPKRFPPGAVYEWLRENARHLAPKGTGDLLLGGAVIIRNWLAVLVVALITVLTAFVLLQAARIALGVIVRVLHSPSAHALQAGLLRLPGGDTVLWWSPWLYVPAVMVVLWVVPLGWAYWIVADRGLRLQRAKATAPGPIVDPIYGLFAGLAFGIAATALAPWLWPETGAWKPLLAISVSAVITLIISLWFRYFANISDPRARQRLAGWLKLSLVITGAALGVALVDTLGQTLYALWMSPDTALARWFTTLGGVLFAVGVSARRISLLLDRKPVGTVGRLSFNTLVPILAFAVYMGFFCVVNALSHGIAWGFGWPGDAPPGLAAKSPYTVQNAEQVLVRDDAAVTRYTLLPADRAGRPAPPPPAEPERAPCVACEPSGGRTLASAAWTLGAFAMGLALCVLFGRTWPFLNRSTLHALYTSRLVRAYLGASNGRRLRPDPRPEDVVMPGPVNVTRILRGDDTMLFDEDQRAGSFNAASPAYWTAGEAGAAGGTPFSKGAPLHLVNVTVNETVSGRSQLEQRDRKGFGLAVGPGGFSAHGRHHAVRSVAREGQPVWRFYPEKAPGDPLPPFRVFPEPGADRQGGRAWGFERLPLGDWVGISGAAFSTGIGANTRLAVSLLAGFFNVRTGYWWDSGVDPSVRDPRVLHREAWWSRWFGAWFPVQAYLLDEFTARFHGPARRWWYLSDGGHFENMGAYELIRRRLPLVIVIDAEADPDYKYEGISNLVRKARIDFDAEIRFLDEFELDEVIKEPSLRLNFGTLSMLRRGVWTRESSPTNRDRDSRLTLEAPSGRRLSLAHAALARVSYEGATEPQSWLVYVKTTLTGDEPADLVQYHAGHIDFPQETTADQFFDEAQWESYRRLGQHIAEKLFGNGLRPF